MKESEQRDARQKETKPPVEIPISTTVGITRFIVLRKIRIVVAFPFVRANPNGLGAFLFKSRF